MAEHYYQTDQFHQPTAPARTIIEEIGIVMSAFDCVLPDDSAIYCSSDITSGKWLYYNLFKKYEVHSEEELIRKIGAEVFKEARRPFFDVNIARGHEFAKKLRERGLVNVVTPGPFYAKKFDQQHYLHLWERFIKYKVYEVWFNDDWEYSNGCSLEYAVAARKGIPRRDYKGNPISLEKAIGKIEAAVKELTTEGFVIKKLEENLDRLKALQI